VTWRDPEIPPIQKLPRPRGPKQPTTIGRVVAGIAGLAFGASALFGLWRALHDASGRATPFGPLAMLIPAALLARYALTGQIRLS
jgi:hypothetical protein